MRLFCCEEEVHLVITSYAIALILDIEICCISFFVAFLFTVEMSYTYSGQRVRSDCWEYGGQHSQRWNMSELHERYLILNNCIFY